MSSYDPDSQLVKELALINCRELGGMPLAGDKTFRTGIFLRSGSPEWLTAGQINEVKEYGVKTVIDLRAVEELKGSGNPFASDPDVDFHNIPLFNGDPNGNDDKTMEFILTHTLGDYYVIIAEEMGDRLAKIMRILLNSDGLTLFHCAHGKDRTGVVAALLYSLCGASRDNIITNYAISYEYLKDFLAPSIAKLPDNMKHILRSDAHNMVTFLDYVDSRWNGDAAALLMANGLSGDEISALRRKCMA
ncbi:MAG: tyrosine-protein phosphatase [Clostridiales bacterium]|nr:tyrosine-protein phosphatase [Clostridiales bacterium]MBR3248048.1 tyrosine-protein phosphatase [Clostridiales bacterium]